MTYTDFPNAEHYQQRQQRRSSKSTSLETIVDDLSKLKSDLEILTQHNTQHLKATHRLGQNVQSIKKILDNAQVFQSNSPLPHKRKPANLVFGTIAKLLALVFFLVSCLYVFLTWDLLLSLIG